MAAAETISFEEFMRRALYAPDTGYYTRRIGGVGGRRADFTTIPAFTAALGHQIAVWAMEALRETGCRDLIEIGPGEGHLAHAIRRNLPWILRHRTRLHLVELSPPLAEIQRKKLGRTATWHETPAAALKACNGQAVIISNELVDAFPVRRFRKTDCGWQELAVTVEAGQVTSESLLPPCPLPESSAFSQSLPEGQSIEVHESYRIWQEEWLPGWQAGRRLTIDYGATADLIYHRRPMGTLRGYNLHQRIEGPAIYHNPGRQDLTADVNFTDLLAWGAPWMTLQSLSNLRGFLGASLPPPLAEEHGPADAFLVLDEKRG